VLSAVGRIVFNSTPDIVRAKLTDRPIGPALSCMLRYATNPTIPITKRTTSVPTAARAAPSELAVVFSSSTLTSAFDASASVQVSSSLPSSQSKCPSHRSVSRMQALFRQTHSCDAQMRGSVTGVGANVDRGAVTGASVGASVGTHSPPALQMLNGEFGMHAGIMPVRQICPWHMPRVQPRWHAVLSALPWQLFTGSKNGVAVLVTITSAHSPPLSHFASPGNSSHRCRSVGKQVPAMHTPRLQPEKQVRIDCALLHDSTGSFDMVEVVAVVVDAVVVVVVVVVLVVVVVVVVVVADVVVTVTVVVPVYVVVVVVAVVTVDVDVVVVTAATVVVTVVGTVVVSVVVDVVVQILHVPHAPGQNMFLTTGDAQLGSLAEDGPFGQLR